MGGLVSAPSVGVVTAASRDGAGRIEAAINRLLENIPPYTDAKTAVTLSDGTVAEAWRKPRARGSGTTRVVRIAGVHGPLVGGWMNMSDARHWAQQQDLKLSEEPPK